MKNGLFTTMQSEKCPGVINRRFCIQRKWGCVCSGGCMVIEYHGFFPRNRMLTSEKHYSQLDRLKATLDEKHLELANPKNIVFNQSNDRHNASLQCQQKLVQLVCDVLLHPNHTHLILHLRITTYLDPNKINEKYLNCQSYTTDFSDQ